MKDPRHDAAFKRARDVLHPTGVRIHDEKLDMVVAAVLRDDTEHDVTRYGRHLDRATSQTKEDR